VLSGDCECGFDGRCLSGDGYDLKGSNRDVPEKSTESSSDILRERVRSLAVSMTKSFCAGSESAVDASRYCELFA
jgi:hypothetical protein